VHFRPDHPLCREGSVQLASVQMSKQPVLTPLCTRTVSDSFQVPIKGRSINRPEDVVSRSDTRLHKAGIAIQIHPSGRQTALVRTRGHQRRKLQFDFNHPDDCLSWSGRVHISYGNCVLKISRPDVHPHGPDARSLIWKILAADVQPSGRLCLPSGRGS
jgi:hypothetical protein